MNPYLIVAALAAVLLAAAGGFKLGVDHEIASQAREDQHIAQAVDAANASAAEAIAKLAPVYTTINNKVRHEVSTHTVFADCRLPASSVLLVDQALAGGAVPTGGSKLPATDTPAR